MKVAFGTRAHSGWAALVVIGEHDGELVVVDRKRIELVEEGRARQPYHAAKGLKAGAARGVVDAGVEAARRIALREMRAAVEKERKRGNEVAAGAVLVGGPMPAWSVEEILAVHFRMHKAEGALYRDALVGATRACGLKLVEIPEKRLMEEAENALRIPPSRLERTVKDLGRSFGPPWGKDQKSAALAALVALRGRSR